MKKLLSVFIATIVIVVFLGLLPIHGEAEIYDSFIRLHVLANSDSAEDQSLKLKVRDVVLKETTKLCEANICENIAEAKKLIEASISKIRESAQNCVFDEGYDYKVEVLLKQEGYPTRNYQNLYFPAGEYLSLQIKIGEAEGENWWCVVFPPLCVSAAASDSVACCESTFVEIGLSGEQYKIITETQNVKYNVRFKILETLDGIFQ